MALVLEYAIFGTLIACNLSLGLYFSFRKSNARVGLRATTEEVFLGSRLLKTIPLAASSVASLFSSTGLVGFPAHYYAYGWHMSWAYVMPLVFMPLSTHVFVPVLYHLRITSIFEYIRLRFNATISLAACAIYIFFTQSIGAISIFAASLTLVTVFKTPLFWCNIFIGLSGTLYTVLGGLRGVVWTDCMQFVIALLAPMAVVAKMFIDGSAPNSTIQPLTGTDVARYMANYSFDLTNDETIWACSLGNSAMAIYRVCWDQVVAQRLLASRTLKDAQRTAQTSALLLVLIYFTGLFLGVALTVWFRGCDPTLLGEISSIDQIVPYYINTYLMDIPGFSGLFLAGIVSAATSTVSSTVNSQAAILHVDVIAPRYKNAESHVLWITRGTALVLGILMTIYSMLCAHMGSVTRAFLMVYNGITAPFVGLCLLAVLFPFVHSKGAGVATLSMIIYQLCHITTIIRSGRRPPRMAASLDSCPGNESSIVSAINATFVDTHRKLEESFVLFRMSYLWTSFIAIFATLIIGVAVSAVTGEMKNVKWQYHLCCGGAVAFWRKLMALCREEKVQGAITPNKNGEQHSQIQEIEKLVPYTIETNI